MARLSRGSIFARGTVPREPKTKRQIHRIRGGQNEKSWRNSTHRRHHAPVSNARVPALPGRPALRTARSYGTSSWPWSLFLREVRPDSAGPTPVPPRSSMDTFVVLLASAFCLDRGQILVRVALYLGRAAFAAHMNRIALDVDRNGRSHGAQRFVHHRTSLLAAIEPRINCRRSGRSRRSASSRGRTGRRRPITRSPAAAASAATRNARSTTTAGKGKSQ